MLTEIGHFFHAAHVRVRQQLSALVLQIQKSMQRRPNENTGRAAADGLGSDASLSRREKMRALCLLKSVFLIFRLLVLSEKAVLRSGGNEIVRLSVAHPDGLKH